jgi:IS605 OrfB family transposase
MKLTLQLQLLPSDDQKTDLLATMEHFNQAATFAAEQGFDAGVFGQVSIHRLAYYAIRERFGLSAQMAVRAIAKAVECFSRDKTVCPVFKPLGAITYDERVLSFKGLNEVSLWGLAGRHRMQFVCGEYQAANLARIRGQCDLVYRDGMFFLYCTIDFQEEPPVEVNDFLGIDLGIVNIAVDSEGEAHSGETIDKNRKRHNTARKQHQRKGSKRAKRKLKAMSGRQRRFQRQTNHTLAKKLVAKAKALGFGMALEDLNGIRDRIEGTVSRRFRRKFGNWSFSHLRLCIEYKARWAGVPLVTVDPRNTSRTCSECGHCEKANRKSPSVFKCKHCQCSLNADHNAAINISHRAVDRLGCPCNPPPKVATPQS